jgi:hypothetical protein
LTPVSGSNTLSCQRETLHTQTRSTQSKIPLTVNTVSTATICRKPAPPVAASAGNFLAKAPQPINGKGFEAVYFHDDPQS